MKKKLLFIGAIFLIAITVAGCAALRKAIGLEGTNTVTVQGTNVISTPK